MMAFPVLLALAVPKIAASFAVYAFVLFVVCFLVVSQGHDTLYDEPPPGIGLKVAAGSLLLAAVLTYTHSSFATMFTDEIRFTVVQAIIWFAVFALIFRFQPWHALGIGLATMLIVTGLATMGVDSLTDRSTAGRFETQAIAPPIRRPAFGGARPAAPTPAPAAAPAAK